MTKFPSKFLSVESFQFLPESSLPILLLGFHIPHDHLRPDSPHSFSPHFKRGREWVNATHENHYWRGTILTPIPIVLEKMKELSIMWRGKLDLSLDIINGYRGTIKRLFGVDCNRSYSLLSSNHFPIDVECVGELTDDVLPQNLDELIQWKSGHERAVYGGKWGLVVFGGGQDNFS